MVRLVFLACFSYVIAYPQNPQNSQLNNNKTGFESI